MKTSEFSTNHLQFYNTMAEIAVAVMGGKKNEAPKIKVNDMEPDQAVASLNDFFASIGQGAG